MRKNVLWLLLVTVGLLFFIGCDDDDNNKSGASVPYDPSRPVELTTFVPDSGGIRTKFVIDGSNFGNDVSKIQVLFDTVRKATIIAANSNTIYCITPKQQPKANTVAVVIENDTVWADKKFTYKVEEKVTRIVEGGGYKNGSLSEARFTRPEALGYIGNNSLLVFDHDGSMSAGSNVRLVSIDENQVVEIEKGKAYSMPAVTKDYNTVYAMTAKSNSDHILYRFQRSTLWMPEKMGKIYDLHSNNEVWGMALDEDEEFLYVTDEGGRLVKIEVKNKNVITRADQVVVNDNLDLGGAGCRACLAWHPQEECFFLTTSKQHGIYKLQKDGTKEPYAGFNGVGLMDGYLQEVQFSQPNGICIDSEGNIYISDSGNQRIRKINYRTGYVSTVMGGGPGSVVDGKPLMVGLNWPYAVVCDEEDNVYIGQRWGGDIRKYAIE